MTFTQQGNLKIHFEKCHKNERYQCDICFQNYNSQNILKKHQNEVHKGSKRKQKSFVSKSDN